jgi:hypothetical protein
LASLLNQLSVHLLQLVIPQSRPSEPLLQWVLLVFPGLEQQVAWEAKHRHGERPPNLPSPNPIHLQPLLVVRPDLPSLEVLEGPTPFRALEAITPRKPALVLVHLDKGNKNLGLQV